MARWPVPDPVARRRSSSSEAQASRFEKPNEAVTGYVLAKDAWGHGYATEALAGIVNVAPGISVKRLRALCHFQHSASRRVLEKCGFTRDGNS